MTADTPKPFGGFWPRVGAWFIDAICLGIVGCAIGWLAMDYVSPLGSSGRYIGLAIAIFYHGLLGSSLGGGQTLGKRLLKLRVVGMNGKTLNPLVALWRAIWLTGPMMLNGWYFNISDPVAVQVLGTVVITAVFGIGLAQVYLILFGGPARRLVHDLFSGSVVIRAETTDFPKPKAGVHAIVAGVLIVAAAGLGVAGPALLQAWLPKVQNLVSDEQRVVDAVGKLPGIGDVGAMDNTTTYYSNGQQTTTRTLVVTARTGKWPDDTDPLMARIGAETVKVYKFAPGQKLTIKIVNGFDLGIASYNNAQSVPYNTACTTADVKCLEK